MITEFISGFAGKDVLILFLVLSNVVTFLWKNIVKNQEEKDSRQDAEVKTLKQRVDEIEKSIDRKLDGIAKSLNQLVTSRELNAEKYKTLYDKLEKQSAEIRHLQEEVSKLKQKVSVIESKIKQ
jgi:peptidoglycan hydrolase CwlO-like protein